MPSRSLPPVVAGDRFSFSLTPLGSPWLHNGLAECSGSQTVVHLPLVGRRSSQGGTWDLLSKS